MPRNPTPAELGRSPFGWNAGGWFGALLGSTIWLLPLGVGALAEHTTAACVAFVSFAAANAWGVALWRRRERLSAYAGVQWLMAGLVVVFAVVIVTLNARIPSVDLPYWAIAAPLPLMGVFWLRQRIARHNERVSGSM